MRRGVSTFLGLWLTVSLSVANAGSTNAQQGPPAPPPLLGVEAGPRASDAHLTPRSAFPRAPAAGHDARPAARPLAVLPKVAMTFTVSSTADTGGVCDLSSCTLRAAMAAANANPGADTIAFDLAGTPPYTIAIQTDLPTVTEAVTIDGTTEPDFAGTPVVVLDGAATTGPQGWGIAISSGNSTVRGLAIHSFASHSAIVLFGGSSNSLVEGNFIGTIAAGTAVVGTGSGIDVATSHDNTIGGTTAAARNLVAGATLPAIVVREGSSGNVVLGNYLGLDVTGTIALPNVGNDLGIFDSSGNTFGGTTPGARNVVAGNSDAGFPSVAVASEVDLDPTTNATGNLIQGNFIGTDVTGNVELGSASVAVYIQDASDNTVGGAGAAGNVIGGGGLGGVRVLAPFTTATGNQVGNSIGVGADGTTPLPNDSNGVRFSHGTSGNTLADNTIANSLLNGVLVRYDAGSGNRVARNRLADNTLLGIDLTVDVLDPGGPTANDPGDGDSGPNGLQNFPLLTATPSPTQVTGTLDSTPNSAVTIEVFRARAAIPPDTGRARSSSVRGRHRPTAPARRPSRSRPTRWWRGST